MISYNEMKSIVNSMKNDNENEVSILADDFEDSARIFDYMSKEISNRNIDAQVDIYINDEPNPRNSLRLIYMRKQS